MSKIRLSVAAALVAVAIPVTAFAAHAATCCGSVECCLRHLGCCFGLM